MRIIMDAGAHVSVEDLGTVPDFVRESVSRLSLPGYRVVRWEPNDPGTYPQMSVAMTGTHDTEPLAVWWDTLADDTRALFARMPSINVDPAEMFSDAVRDAILKAVYNSPSQMVLIPIQDVFGWRDRINHPATIGDWNWTYVLPWPIDLVTAQPDAAEAAQRIGRLCSEAGR
jgi:4-alpha-glucanotransferase